METCTTMFDSPSDYEVERVIANVNRICDKYGCWVIWEDSNPWKRELAIDGTSHENMVDCAEAIGNYINRINEEEQRRNV